MILLGPRKLWEEPEPCTGDQPGVGRGRDDSPPVRIQDVVPPPLPLPPASTRGPPIPGGLPALCLRGPLAVVLSEKQQRAACDQAGQRLRPAVSQHWPAHSRLPSPCQQESCFPWPHLREALHLLKWPVDQGGQCPRPWPPLSPLPAQQGRHLFISFQSEESLRCRRV